MHPPQLQLYNATGSFIYYIHNTVLLRNDHFLTQGGRIILSFANKLCMQENMKNSVEATTSNTGVQIWEHMASGTRHRFNVETPERSIV